MIQYAYYNTPLGTVKIGYAEDAIVFCKIVDSQESKNLPCPLTDLANKQLEEYFTGLRRKFDLPLCPSGTAFQQAVWLALSNIPYGETRSYAQIARSIGRETACRAVGNACNRNPIWLFIPCHRVLGARGNLTGYAGGLSLKKELLKLEAAEGLKDFLAKT